jgi:ketosteroid isomerase-like protein
MENNIERNAGLSLSAITNDEVRAKFDQFIDALKTGDIGTLETIYDDDYLLVRADGQTLSKSQILDDLKKSGMIFPRFEGKNLRIKTLGPVGVLTTESLSSSLRNGQESKMHAQQMMVFFKAGKEVTLTHVQLTNIAGG